MELGSGKITAVGDSQVIGVAFAPDSTEFAFQVGYLEAQEVIIARLDGTIARRIPAASQSRLGGANAWSPDGKWLAMVTYFGVRSYTFLNTAGTAEQVPATIPATGIVNNAWGDAVLGWRSPTSMLVSGCDVGGTTSNLIVEVNIVTGSRQVVSRFTVGQSDDLAVGDVQLAAGLLDGISIRHSTSPDRGVWPTWAIVVTALCLTLFVILVARWYRRSRRSS